MRIAAFITGTICSGKTALAEKIGRALNIEVINETNSGGFFGIIDRVKNYSPGAAGVSPVIAEHAEVYNLINESRELEISKYFDKIIIVLLNVSDGVLSDNLNSRKANGITGDYLNIDVREMKREIQNYFDNVNGDKYVKITANIINRGDYATEYKRINDLLREELFCEAIY